MYPSSTLGQPKRFSSEVGRGTASLVGQASPLSSTFDRLGSGCNQVSGSRLRWWSVRVRPTSRSHGETAVKGNRSRCSSSTCRFSSRSVETHLGQRGSYAARLSSPATGGHVVTVSIPPPTPQDERERAGQRSVQGRSRRSKRPLVIGLSSRFPVPMANHTGVICHSPPVGLWAGGDGDGSLGATDP